MPSGTIKCYATSGGKNLICDWYRDQPPAVRAAFREFVEAVAQQPFERWGPPDIATLHGKWSKLHKFKIRVANSQLRPLGFFGPGRHEYTLLYPASEKDRKWVPGNAKDQALKRMKEVMENPEQAVEYIFPTLGR